MSESIEFPLNFTRYLEMGKEALEEGNLAEAKINLFQAYDLEESFEANYLLVQVLVDLGEFTHAKAIASEMKSDYLSAPKKFPLYLKVLLGNQEFIVSRKLIQGISQTATEKKAYLEEVAQSETFFLNYQQKDLLKRQAEIAVLLSGNFFKQGQGLRQLEALPLRLYLSQSEKIIASQDLPLLLRNSLLESLVELGVDSELKLVDINNNPQRIQTSQLTLVVEQQSYQAAVKEVKANFDQSDSDLLKGLLEELRLQFTCLYPFADQVIEAGDHWGKLVVANYLGADYDLEGGQSLAYQKLQGSIQKELAEMITSF